MLSMPEVFVSAAGFKAGKCHGGLRWVIEWEVQNVAMSSEPHEIQQLKGTWKRQQSHCSHNFMLKMSM